MLRLHNGTLKLASHAPVSTTGTTRDIGVVGFCEMQPSRDTTKPRTVPALQFK